MTVGPSRWAQIREGGRDASTYVKFTLKVSLLASKRGKCTFLNDTERTVFLHTGRRRLPRTAKRILPKRSTS